MSRRWTTTHDGKWVECDGHGRPLPGAELHDELPPVRPGDVMASGDALRLSEQMALGQSAPSFSARLESAKLALSLVSNNGRRT